MPINTNHIAIIDATITQYQSTLIKSSKYFSGLAVLVGRDAKRFVFACLVIIDPFPLILHLFISLKFYIVIIFQPKAKFFKYIVVLKMRVI